MNMWQTNQFCELAPSLLAGAGNIEWRQKERENYDFKVNVSGRVEKHGELLFEQDLSYFYPMSLIKR